MRAVIVIVIGLLACAGATSQEQVIRIKLAAEMVAAIEEQIETERGIEIEGQERPPAITVQQYCARALRQQLRHILERRMKSPEMEALRLEIEVKTQELEDLRKKAIEEGP